ncbi:hypothetical protein E2C01_023759 [Portunus trituberculatus]|uniref:Uncharacterized protein n=1 Tax=Portunus trituberculatus TaxID=210409 RepID=A0A5B7E916_PORTR|nr:hypothetical protein [Portunus trituberculatus]
MHGGLSLSPPPRHLQGFCFLCPLESHLKSRDGTGNNVSFRGRVLQYEKLLTDNEGGTGRYFAPWVIRPDVAITQSQYLQHARQPVQGRAAALVFRSVSRVVWDKGGGHGPNFSRVAPLRKRFERSFRFEPSLTGARGCESAEDCGELPSRKVEKTA